MTISELLIRWTLKAYPRAYRERFSDEVLAAFLDERDVIAQREAPATALRHHAARSVAGLLGSVIPVHLHERRRRRFPHLDPAPRSPAMRQFIQDARHTLRGLRKQPGFASIVILTLALGIGANTAVFSVLSSVILSPLPYDESRQLVRVYNSTDDDQLERGFLTVPDILDARDEVKAFTSVGINYTYRDVGGDLTSTDGATRRIRLMPVNAEYFRTLRATPLIGRTFTREEEQADVRRIVLSHALWAGVSGRDSSIVGRTLLIDGVATEVIGVMRRTFHDVVTGDVDAWTPANLALTGSNNRGNHYLSAIARLSPGASVAQAQSQVDALMRRLAESFPNTNAARRMRVVPLHDDVVGESSAAVFILMGAAGLVLLIACLNVANLFIARSVAQSHDTAIRTALGAGRSRLVGQRLTESVVVAAVGGWLGSLLAFWGVKVLLSVSPEALARAEEVGFDPRLLIFAIVVTATTGLLFGGWPAWRASRVDPSDALHDGSRGNTAGRGSRQARDLLVASQVSVAIVLLVGAGILLRSFIERQRVDLGIEVSGVTTFEVNLPPARYADGAARVRFHEAYQERLNTVPGVELVGLTSWLPANGHYHQWGFRPLGTTAPEDWTAAQVRVVDGSFLEAMHIPLLNGRNFMSTDRLDTDGVALISQSLARRRYGESDPIGKQFATGGRRFSVIGVVADVAYEASGTRFDMVYLTHDQFANDRNWSLKYVVRASLPPSQVVDLARRELTAIDPGLVLHEPRTMDAVLARHRARDWFMLLLIGTFASVALTLAAVGVYGVVSYAVTQRTHEIGVRMALGARPTQVRLIVMRSGLAAATAGVAVGLVGAFALSRVLGTIAFGVSPRDPLVFITVAGVLSLVVVVAGWLPARRATRVDPLESLRRG